MKQSLWFAMLLIMATLLAGCGSGDASVTINMENMAFDKSEVRVKAGQAVALRVVNRDGYAHAFDIDDLDIHAPLPAKATFDAAFTPQQPGRYRFYCGAPGHEAAGMVGVLVVGP